VPHSVAHMIRRSWFHSIAANRQRPTRIVRSAMSKCSTLMPIPSMAGLHLCDRYSSVAVGREDPDMRCFYSDVSTKDPHRPMFRLLSSGDPFFYFLISPVVSSQDSSQGGSPRGDCCASHPSVTCARYSSLPSSRDASQTTAFPPLPLARSRTPETSARRASLRRTSSGHSITSSRLLSYGRPSISWSPRA
jgi:hypothetical protein